MLPCSCVLYAGREVDGFDDVAVRLTRHSLFFPFFFFSSVNPFSNLVPIPVSTVATFLLPRAVLR